MRGPRSVGRTRGKRTWSLGSRSILFVLIALVMSNLCLCDRKSITSSLPPPSSSSSSSLSSPIRQANHVNSPQKHSQQQATQQVLVKPIRGQQQSKASAASHREDLIASLSDSIERQHFRIKPIRALVQLRPSKFDNGRESLSNEPSEFRPIKVAGSSSATSQTSQSSFQWPKQDASMSQIIMMHEHAALAGTKTKTGGSSGGSQDSSEAGTRWRDLARSPVKTASSLIASNKVVAQVLHYLAPIASGPSLLSGSFLPNSTSLAIIKADGNPFSARAHQNHSIRPADPAPESSKAAPLSPTSINTGNQPLPLAPQSALLRGLRYLANGLSSPASLSKMRPSETAEGPLESYSADLMADSSQSIEHLPLRAADMKTENLPKLSTSSFSTQHQAAGGARLEKGANQGAQSSYLQDSFRDLLTLSQLPILSGGPTSTAPSDLEPGGKQWLANKMVAQQTWGNRSQSIEDLLRFAYIFGARRKRDPLKALGSPPPSIIQRRPSLLDSLTRPASPMAVASTKPITDKQSTSISPFANRFGSLLATNKSAKPRGVMWDMATDPTLAVTVFHLLERASVALPLGEYLLYSKIS